MSGFGDGGHNSPAGWATTAGKPGSGAVDALLVIFLVLLFALPARLVFPGFGAVGRPALLLGLGLAVLLFAGSFSRTTYSWTRNPGFLLLSIFALTNAASYAAGYDRGLLPLEATSTDRWMISVTSWVAVALAVMSWVRTMRQVEQLACVTVVLAALSGFVGILQFYGFDAVPFVRVPGLQYNEALVGLGERGGPQFNRVYGTAQHYIEFSVVLAACLPLAFFLLTSGARRRVKVVAALSAIVMVLAIPLAVSRAGVLCLAILVACYLFAWRGRRRLWLTAGAIAAMVGLMVGAPGLLGTLRSAFENVDNDPSIQNRLSDYSTIATYFAERPLLGRGPGTFVPELYILLDNQLLGSLVATGALGAAAWLSILVWPIYVARAVRQTASLDVRNLGLAVGVSALVLTVSALTFDGLSFPTYTGVFFLMVGLASVAWNMASSDPSWPSRRK